MLIGTKAKLRQATSVKIKINDTNLERVKECKYLGVLLDETLSWKPQINQVRNKALRNIHLLKRTNSYDYVDNRTALLLYSASQKEKNRTLKQWNAASMLWGV